MDQAPSDALVFFGATGDLAYKKIFPSLQAMVKHDRLDVPVIGVAKAGWNLDQLKARARDSVEKHGGVDSAAFEKLLGLLRYVDGDYNDLATFQALRKELGNAAHPAHYLAIPPVMFGPVVEQLTKADCTRGARVIIEKPFGSDLASARELNRVVSNSFSEEQTYRIDHFLGKETAQNILVLRFANAIFEPLWNTRYIDHVQITAAETLGVEGRAGYYEGACALRDMVQNHLLQLLCLIGMEAPSDLSADSIRDEKVKVVRCLRRMAADEVTSNVVRGQYAEGAINGKSVPGYRGEEKVDPKSMTDTFVALRLNIDNWRWWDVPIYMRVGKRLPKSGTEISVHFKKAPFVLFNKETNEANVLVVRIQPDEGISLRMQAKMPGTSFRIEPVKMDFHYGTSFGKASPEAYERLLLDAMSGDATLFARRDEVEQAWAVIDVIENAWTAKKNTPELFFYPAGSWGPEEADELLARDGRAWRRF